MMAKFTGGNTNPNMPNWSCRDGEHKNQTKISYLKVHPTKSWRIIVSNGWDGED